LPAPDKRDIQQKYLLAQQLDFRHKPDALPIANNKVAPLIDPFIVIYRQKKNIDNTLNPL